MDAGEVFPPLARDPAPAFIYHINDPLRLYDEAVSEHARRRQCVGEDAAVDDLELLTEKMGCWVSVTSVILAAFIHLCIIL